MYHIVYKKEKSDFYSQGMNIESNTPIEALTKFKELEPSAIFLAMYIVTEHLYFPTN